MQVSQVAAGPSIPPARAFSAGLIGDNKAGEIPLEDIPVSKPKPNAFADRLPSAAAEKLPTDKDTGPCGISIPQLPHATGSGTGATAILKVNSLGRKGTLLEASSGRSIGSGSAGMHGDACG